MTSFLKSVYINFAFILFKHMDTYKQTHNNARMASVTLISGEEEERERGIWTRFKLVRLQLIAPLNTLTNICTYTAKLKRQNMFFFFVLFCVYYLCICCVFERVKRALIEAKICCISPPLLKSEWIVCRCCRIIQNHWNTNAVSFLFPMEQFIFVFALHSALLLLVGFYC